MRKSSILCVGLDPDHPAVAAIQMPGLPKPSEVRQAVEAADLQMKKMGYSDYKGVMIDPETHIKELTSLLKEKPWDALIIGGGFKMIPAFNTQLEEIINLSKEISPKTRILFSLGPKGIPDAAKRFEAS